MENPVPKQDEYVWNQQSDNLPRETERREANRNKNIGFKEVVETSIESSPHLGDQRYSSYTNWTFFRLHVVNSSKYRGKAEDDHIFEVEEIA